MADPTGLIHVAIHPDTETLHTSVSRDVWDDYYEVPEALVTAVEAAEAQLDAATQALTDYVEANNLVRQYREFAD